MRLALAAVAAYLLGGFPFAVLAGKLKGVDLLATGSKNPGATNAIRVLGPAIGVPVLLLDILKGYLAVVGLGALAGGGDGARLLCAAAAVVGHVWPPYLGFRGGKGVATAGGVFLGLAPAATSISLLVFALLLLALRYVSVASMAAAVTLPIALFLRGAPRTVLVVGVATAFLVLLRHRANVSRLFQGTESRVHFGGKREVSS